MKNLKFFLCFSLLFVAFASAAQTRVTFVNRNGDERFGNNLTTTDSAFHYLDSVTIKSNEGGMVEVKVVGYAKDTLYCVTGAKKVRFSKRAGTLTMGTVIDGQAVVTDTPLGSATFDLVAANNKIYLRVKGKLGNTITWCSILKRTSVSYP